MSENTLQHIQHLSVTIGPRGSTTDKERAGHNYVKETLEGLGHAPIEEKFVGAFSPYQPFALALGLTLAAWALFYTLGPAGALAASVLSLVIAVSVGLELRVKDNPLRWFSTPGDSQNLFTVAPAAGERRKRVVLAAHVDSHRTPLIWASRAAFRVYRILSTLGTVSLFLLVILFIVGLFAPASAWPRTLSVYPVVVVGVAFLMVVQGHFTRYTAGANDNASGVGILLSFAEKLRAEPLPATEVTLLFTGCEEVGAHGMANFVRHHRAEYADASFLIVDNVAGKGVGACYLRSEGLVFPQRHSPALLALADRLAQDRPDLNAYSYSQQGAYTDAFFPLAAGLPALSITGYTKDGWIPNWHNQTDTFDRVDGETVERNEQFVWELLKRIDGG